MKRIAHGRGLIIVMLMPVSKLIRLLLLAALSVSQIVTAQQYIISTIAGGAPPPTPVPPLTASIGNPTLVATGPSGNLYFVSWNCIFRLDASGLLSRVAGNGTADSSGDGGLAINAQIAQVGALAVDQSGNIYISESANNRVRKITTDGMIATVAGTGQYGLSSDGVPGPSASLRRPYGLAVDRQGNLLISEEGRIRKLSASGIISTLAGSGTGGYSGDGGPAIDAQIQPGYMAVDSAGNVFVADAARIRRISPSGTITTIAGTGEPGYSGDGGPATRANLTLRSIAVDLKGNLYVSDFEHIRKISATGTISTFAGNPGRTALDGVAATSTAIDAAGMAVDLNGDLVFADPEAHRVRKILSNGTVVAVAGNGTPGLSGDGLSAMRAQLLPYGVAVDRDGNIFVTDRYNHRVRKISRAGIITTVAGSGIQGYSGDGGPAVNAQLDSPLGVAIDAGGNLLIADTNNNRIRRVSNSGTITTFAGTGIQGYSGDGGPAINARLGVPSSIAVDAQGSVFICDTANDRVRRVSTAGLITTVAGNGTRGGGGDRGPAIAAELHLPNGLAVDSRSNLFIAEPFGHRIRKVSAAGIIETFAGSGSFGYSGDGGPAVNATLFAPYGVAVDPQGTVLIADTYNFRIRAVDAGGKITTVAGTGACCHSGDGGPAISANFDFVLQVASDAQGRVYATSGNSIRALEPINRSVWLAAVVNAATQQIGPISSGEMIVLYGTGLGPDILTPNLPVDGVYSTQAGGTGVSIGGIPAPLLYSSATQTAAIVPYGITGTLASISVTYRGQTSVPVTLPVAATAPGLFTLNQSGTGQAAALNALLGTINSNANPIPIGGYVSLFATGGGRTTPAGIDGKIATGAVLPMPLEKVLVTIDGLPAEVQYAGAAPGQVAGLMQVNVKIPEGVRMYSSVRVVLQVGNASTPVQNSPLLSIGGR